MQLSKIHVGIALKTALNVFCRTLRDAQNGKSTKCTYR